MKKLLSTFIISAPLLIIGCNANMPQVLQTSADVASATGYGNQAQLIKGVKEVLQLGSLRAANELSQTGGYAQSSLYRINLPDTIKPLASNLRALGLGSSIDKVEALMNQGAEKAAVEAAAVFSDAIKNMSVTDALGIVRGSNTAATDYFRTQTESSLRARYAPIIQANLKQVGFYNQYQQVLNAYNQLPIANKPSLDLEKHVIDQSLNALFAKVAIEEQAIRQDPVGRGSSIIGAIFAR